jgi:hypothetical protein
MAMPAPTPIPRGPTVLTLYTADDLLTGPGCPVCRYTGEADDRYRAWFALEAHADAATITGLCSSLGMCPRHTRGLASQPGGASRLTALYRYIMEAARDRLGGRVAHLDRCPACRHDATATDRALDTLIEGLAEDSVRERYRELGGLCIPHLGSAPRRRGGRQVFAWLSQTMADSVNADPAAVRWLAGEDQDAETRAALRRATPASAPPGRDMCIACLAAEHSEQSHLAQVQRIGGHGRPDRRSLLCAGHLADLTVSAGERDVSPLLAWQAGCLAASPADRRLRRRRAGVPGDCPVCLASEHAAQQAVEDCRPVCDPQAALCVRHLLGLRALDPRAAQVAARCAVERADVLIAELNEAFSKRTWARRHEPRGREMTAWRRAAAFVDGRMFCGCPPR